jgi:hypothetical protein
MERGTLVLGFGDLVAERVEIEGSGVEGGAEGSDLIAAKRESMHRKQKESADDCMSAGSAAGGQAAAKIVQLTANSHNSKYLI